MRPSSLSLTFGIEKGRLRVKQSYHNENQSKKQIDEPGERVAIMRSAHGRADGVTFTTSASFIVSADGARLLAGRHITARAANALTRNAEAHANAPAVLPFKPRRRFQSADRRAA
jgi:hypothetical protein